MKVLRYFRNGALFLATTATAAASYDYFSQDYIFRRVFRTIKCGIHILYSFKYEFNQNNYLRIHEEVAEDIYNTCINNDGLYVKFGQGIAAMDHLLPPPFFKHLSKLQDKAKAVSFQKIKQVFEKQEGLKLEEVFQTFEEEPIASASLAQVHRAKLKNGREVAVKIQKPHIRKQFSSDMAMHHLINFVLEKAFDLPFLHFVDDIQTNLRKELDFRIEADNSRKGKFHFEQLHRNELYVPEVIEQYTTQRVMVSEWIEGFKITDEEKMNFYRMDKKAVLHDLIRGFAEQIFITGFIHCDPHPGNILVRPDPKNPKKHQLVILDFGLCISVSDTFRQNYATFWRSLFLHDEAELKRICQSWGMKFSEEFAVTQLMRPYSKQKLLSQKVNSKDVIKMQLEMKDKVRALMKQTIHFPKELLFISRNMNLVRSLNKFYGGVADRISIMAKAAYTGSEIQSSKRIAVRAWHFSWNSFRFSMHLWAIQAISWLMNLFTGKNMDEHLEEEQVNQSKRMFLDYGFKPLTENTYNA